MGMKLGARGLELIKSFEGLELKLYTCAAGKKTIGYGHVLVGKENYKQITALEAENILKSDVEKFEKEVSSLVKVPITQNQFDALVSFAFNVGTDIDEDVIPEGLGDSTLLKKLNKKDYLGAADEFLKWNKAGGKVLKGLERRRAAERALFLRVN